MLCIIAYINTYSIQTFSIKNSLAFTKDTQPAMKFYNLQTKYTTTSSKTTLLQGCLWTCPKRHYNKLLKKSEINGIVGKNLQCYKNYLNNRKQYIQINNEEKANLLLANCLGSLLFLIYVNNFQFTRHEQVCLIRLRFERYFSHHRET